MINIAVSACLLGQNVRYDGGHKKADIRSHFDSSIYTLTGLCPEVEIGMSIPRAPIQINKSLTQSLKLVQVNDPTIDLSTTMNQWFITNQARLELFNGFILKSQSPSCGNQTTKHFDETNKFTINDGYFVYLLKKFNPKIAIIDEINLQITSSRTHFTQQLNR